MDVVLRRNGDVIEVRMDYDQALVAALRRLPKACRRWRPDDKTWDVDASLAAWLLGELRARGATVTWLPCVGHTPWDILYLQPDAPLEVAEAAYRVLAKQWHPDRVAGEEKAAATEMMKRLNWAIECIRNQSDSNGA